MNTSDTLLVIINCHRLVSFILLGEASVVGRWHFAVRADCTAVYYGGR